MEIDYKLGSKFLTKKIYVYFSISGKGGHGNVSKIRLVNLVVIGSSLFYLFSQSKI